MSVLLTLLGSESLGASTLGNLSYSLGAFKKKKTQQDFIIRKHLVGWRQEDRSEGRL